MTRRAGTLPADYFDALYRADPDPWRFRSSTYERDKYAATLAALTRSRYPDALEIGCSIGVLTRLLAGRCDDLLSIDGSSIALEAARHTCAACANVHFEQAMVPEMFPEGRFDLIVLSEVLYYLSPSDLDRTAERCLGALKPGGEIVLCHWLGETDYPMTGEDATERFVAAGLRRSAAHTVLHEDAYRLDRLRL